MTDPVRLQLSRKKGFDLQTHSRAVNGLDAVKCSRPGKWGNPHKIWPVKGATALSASDAVRKFRQDAEEAIAIEPKALEEIIRELRGKNLACWCAPGAPCHADVLLDIANRPICEPLDAPIASAPGA